MDATTGSDPHQAPPARSSAMIDSSDETEVCRQVTCIMEERHAKNRSFASCGPSSRDHSSGGGERYNHCIVAPIHRQALLVRNGGAQRRMRDNGRVGAREFRASVWKIPRWGPCSLRRTRARCSSTSSHGAACCDGFPASRCPDSRFQETEQQGAAVLCCLCVAISPVLTNQAFAGAVVCATAKISTSARVAVMTEQRAATSSIVASRWMMPTARHRNEQRYM